MPPASRVWSKQWVRSVNATSVLCSFPLSPPAWYNFAAFDCSDENICLRWLATCPTIKSYQFEDLCFALARSRTLSQVGLFCQAQLHFHSLCYISKRQQSVKTCLHFLCRGERKCPSERKCVCACMWVGVCAGVCVCVAYGCKCVCRVCVLACVCECVVYSSVFMQQEKSSKFHFFSH